MNPAFEEIISRLTNNKKDVFEEACRIILKIADNILNDPSNVKYRTLNKSNTTIFKKVLSINGGIDCLKLMGFEENSNNFVLPITAPLNRMLLVRNEIASRQKNVDNRDKKLIANGSSEIPKQKNEVVQPSTSKHLKMETEPIIKQIVLPKLTLMFSNPFLNRVEKHFHEAVVYGNKDLQKRAFNLIPHSLLEDSAKTKLRQLQEKVKKEKLNVPDVGLQDFLILELLTWFKEEFFTWVDSPPCDKCGGKTHFDHMSSDPLLLKYTSRVEMHKCACGHLTAFPRFNDLNILLETRRGRCGEWANTFTLFCRAMDWDARIVYDETDHVWTEVYSNAQKRWLHCDSCENACDTPLIYENGWGKHVSYVIAYSDEEVQDVTWRYSSNHREVLKRRTQCKEEELTDALIKLRKLRQKDFSSQRKLYLDKRILFELLELLQEKKPSSKDQQGRVSGSTDWKVSRGECKVGKYIWTIPNKPSITIQYSTASDEYEYRLSGINKTLFSLKGWNSGILEAENIFRKEEKDWKQVYLARTEGTDKGKLVWKFVVQDQNVAINEIHLNFKHQLYETGNVNIKICSENECIIIPKGQHELKTSSFSGSKYITITTELTGGNGDVSWQHAQLFRQPSDSLEYPFIITISTQNIL